MSLTNVSLEFVAMNSNVDHTVTISPTGLRHVETKDLPTFQNAGYMSLICVYLS